MKWSILVTLLLMWGFQSGYSSVFAQNDSTENAADSSKTEENDEEKSKKKKPKEPKFEDLIEGYTKSEGLFTVYSDEKKKTKYYYILYVSNLWC